MTHYEDNLIVLKLVRSSNFICAAMLEKKKF